MQDSAIWSDTSVRRPDYVPQRWLQIRGDPAVRQFLFEQRRATAEFDLRIDEVIERVELLMRERSVFHAKVHFSSGEVTLWSLHDPLRYRVHTKEEFFDQRLLHDYPRSPYTGLAVVSAPAIGQVWREFKRLRMQDSQIYLRAGSLNVVNGTVGLNFSCDGSHYLDYREFMTHAQALFA